MIYGCRRTATVLSRNYATLGKLTKRVLSEIEYENPGIMLQLKDRLVRYADPNKKFLKAALKRVEYLADIGEELLTDIIYSFTHTTYKSGYMLYKVNQNVE